MKLTVRKPMEIECDAIRCVLPVRYGEEDIPNDFPFRKGNVWEVTIDIETGTIRQWPPGRAEEVYMKVVDGGCYYLLDGEHILASIEQDYVPDCVPNSYGDYIDFNINAQGRITNFVKGVKEIAANFFPLDED